MTMNDEDFKKYVYEGLMRIETNLDNTTKVLSDIQPRITELEKFRNTFEGSSTTSNKIMSIVVGVGVGIVVALATLLMGKAI